MSWEVVLERESLSTGNTLGVAPLLPQILLFATNGAQGVLVMI